MSDLIIRLRPAAPAARWVRAENLHVTLKFIGEKPPANLGPIRDALSNVRIAAPIQIHFRGLGFFPDERRPRVLFAGIEASPNLASLAADIDARLAPLGVPREARPFTPHLTLTRLAEPRPAPKLFEAVGLLRAAEFGTMKAAEFHLIESHLKPSGAEYARLATFAFAEVDA